MNVASGHEQFHAAVHAAGNDREEDWHFDGPSNIPLLVTDGLFPRRELWSLQKYEQQRHPVNCTNMGCLSDPGPGLNVGRNTESEREAVLAWAVITNYHRLVA